MRRLAAVLTIIFFSVVTQAQNSKPTLADAQEFMKNAEARLAELSVKGNQAQWVQENFITEDTEALAADANDEISAVTTDLVEQSKRFDGLNMPPELARKFLLLRLGLTAPTPKDPALRKEMTQIAASLDADYGKGKYCKTASDCLDITQIETKMASSRDPQELLDLWKGWHSIGPPMRDRFARFVELSNQGAREMGFKDTGALWRSGYDMPPDAFSADLERLWNQVRPLYL
ncbi:MAG: M2 family metallopeptidase, partial [Terriglobales bacterium]